MDSIPTHPLADTFTALARLNKRYSRLVQAAPGGSEGWFCVADFSAESYTRMAAVLEHYRDAHPASDALAPASRWFAGYLNDLMIVVFGCYLSGKCLPDLRPEQVWACFDERGEVSGLAWPGPQVRWLAGVSPGALLCDSSDTLREEMRSALIAHLEPVSQALAACSVFKKPAIWALAADYVAKTMQWSARQLGNELMGIQEARLVNAPPSKLHRKRDFIQVEADSGSVFIVERSACCQKRFILGKTNCATCPHRPLEERIELAKAKGEE